MQNSTIMDTENGVSSNITLDDVLVNNGIHTLLEYIKKSKNASDNVLDENSKINLQLCYKKVPTSKRTTQTKAILPHTLICGNTDVCLFVADLNKKDDPELTVEHYRELLETSGIKPRPEIIPLKSLMTEYKQYEAKRALSNSYNKFLADARIFHRLPHILGKNFYGRRRYPGQVDLNSKDLTKEFDKVLRTTSCTLRGKGSSCLVEFSHSGHTESQAIENLMAVVNTIIPKLPGGAVNIRNLHVKTTDSPAIPIYVSDGKLEDVVLPKRKNKRVMDEFEDVTPVLHGKIRVTPWGRIQYQSDDDDENEEDDENESEEDEEASEDVNSDEDEGPSLKRAKLSKKIVKEDKNAKRKKEKEERKKEAKHTAKLEAAFMKKRKNIAAKKENIAKNQDKPSTTPSKTNSKKKVNNKLTENKKNIVKEKSSEKKQQPKDKKAAQANKKANKKQETAKRVTKNVAAKKRKTTKSGK